MMKNLFEGLESFAWQTIVIVMFKVFDCHDAWQTSQNLQLLMLISFVWHNG